MWSCPSTSSPGKSGCSVTSDSASRGCFCTVVALCHTAPRETKAIVEMEVSVVQGIAEKVSGNEQEGGYARPRNKTRPREGKTGVSEAS